MKKIFSSIAILAVSATCFTACFNLDEVAYSEILQESFVPNEQDVAALLASSYSEFGAFMDWYGMFDAQEEAADVVITPARPNGWVDGGVYQRPRHGPDQGRLPECRRAGRVRPGRAQGRPRPLVCGAAGFPRQCAHRDVLQGHRAAQAELPPPRVRVRDQAVYRGHRARRAVGRKIRRDLRPPEYVGCQDGPHACVPERRGLYRHRAGQGHPGLRQGPGPRRGHHPQRPLYPVRQVPGQFPGLR